MNKTTGAGAPGSGDAPTQGYAMAWCRYQNANNRYQYANVTASLSCQRDADTHVTDTTARVRRGVASRRNEVRHRAWSRYQITNNRYQSANVAAGLSCQRDADMGVTDAAALSDYE